MNPEEQNICTIEEYRQLCSLAKQLIQKEKNDYQSVVSEKQSVEDARKKAESKVENLQKLFRQAQALTEE